ncbi:hypothetical protein GDO81_007768 [Engystomops pustulosus]|uniref:Uncharacterized protein n=1 Tax=Engystomops pustulosus TaxID=76066 RepID=A0AAV7C9H0_ENGPU|nr:hypothetical protein GDO81_007768 [Engystomops pustulosus]
MAAVVLAEGSAVPAYTGILHNGHGVPTTSGTGVGPAAWNRSLERALEEAAVTGSLNLSGRKLREFPRSAARPDLSDTTQAAQDVSCNEIQTLPQQIGKLESLRDLNIRRNHLMRLPEELADLPLVRLDFSCNKVTSIPACYRNLRHLQTIILDNNPLQSPPAQICIKGKIHIFKYLNIEALKNASDLPEYERRPLGFTTW